MALTIPYVFTAGTPAKAAEVNSNFTAISNWANSNSFDTESFGILYPRVSPLPSVPYYPILRLEQSSGNQALYIRNSGTGESIEIVQNAALGAGKSAILLTDSQTQTGIGCAELKMVLGANVDIPAIHITHNSVDIFKVNQNGVKPPIKTTVQRNAIVSPETGSVLYDSTTQQLNERRSDGWAPIGPPVGSVQMFAGSAAPEGWLLCDGATLNSVANTKYAALFAVINTTYGGTGASSFKVPDCRGIFVRGAGSQTISGETYTATLGVAQKDATAVNGLTVNTKTGLTVLVPAIVGRAQDENDSDNERMVNNDSNRITYNLNHDHTLASTDTETRPANVAMNYIIKY